MIESGIGYIIRVHNDGKNWYWSGAFKDVMWMPSIYSAKMYKYLERAQSVIDRRSEDDYTGLWQKAEIVKIKFQETT